MSPQKPRWPAKAVFVLSLLLGTLPAWAAPTRLTFLHINDVYQFMPQAALGGLAETATLLERERTRSPNAVVTFGGDLISPSLASNLTRGSHMIDLFNLMGVELAVPGNHEFDFGPKVLLERLAESRFTWIASNIEGADGRPFGGAKARVIRDMGGFKVGFFGVLTERTGELAADTRGVRFTPALAAAQEAVRSLRAEGAEIIVGLTHLTLAEDRQLAREVEGIHVILGGHDHDAYGLYENGSLILKAGYDAHYLAVADLIADRREGKVVLTPEWRFTAVRELPPEQRVGERAHHYETQVEAAFTKPLTTLEAPMSSLEEQVRGRESSLGNLFADALRNALHADVALLNGGGLRGNREYAAGSGLTRRDVMTEMPFGNQAVLLEVSGRTLLEALEYAVGALPAKAGRFPQISGMRIEVDSAAPPGSRIVSAEVGGTPLGPESSYRLATTDYLARGGDGFTQFKAARMLVDPNDAGLASTVVMDYLAAQPTVAPRLDGRIVVR